MNVKSLITACYHCINKRDDCRLMHVSSTIANAIQYNKAFPKTTWINSTINPEPGWETV